MTLYEATEDDIWIVQLLAKRAWPIAFAEILSEEQIAYMMDMMYSTQSLQQQLGDGHHFLLAKQDGEYVGYLSYQLDYKVKGCTKVHKIYVLPATQGKGVGRFLIDSAMEIAKEKQQMSLSLNVNRYNKAIDFYQRIGFAIAGEENIDIGDGFLMEDYIMQRSIQ